MRPRARSSLLIGVLALALVSAIALAEPGVWWLAARLVTDRWAELEFDAGEEAEIWVDGEPVDGATAVPAGPCFVYVRVETAEAGGAVTKAADGREPRGG